MLPLTFAVKGVARLLAGLTRLPELIAFPIVAVPGTQFSRHGQSAIGRRCRAMRIAALPHSQQFVPFGTMVIAGNSPASPTERTGLLSLPGHLARDDRSRRSVPWLLPPITTAVRCQR
jgi:hypothetical protein